MWHNSVPRRPTVGERGLGCASRFAVERIEFNPQIRDCASRFRTPLPNTRRGGFVDTGMAATVHPQTQQLELAHVLLLDIAGSSSLPASQQRVLLENLQEFVRRTSEFGRARAKDQIS